MKKLITLVFFILLCEWCVAQSWVEIPNNPATKSGRTRNRGFAINGTGYVMGGSDDYNYYGSEAWAYDTTTKSWSAIAAYPDVNGDDGKSAVAVDSLGYEGIGGGSTLGVWVNTWYSYSQTQNKWTALAPFPGPARGYAATFTIGGEIYIAGGMNGNNNHGTFDFYKYTPSTNSWRRLADCPATGVNFASVAFAINGKGYVCTGAFIDSTNGAMTAQNSVWEYDPTDSTWTQKNNFPAAARIEAIGWATCNRGYLGGGYTTHSPQTLDSDFYEYNPATDTWKQIANYGGGNLNGAATFVIGKTGYVIGGQRDSANYQQARGYVWTNDDWTYTKLDTPAFTSSAINTCAGNSISFTDTSDYSPTSWSWNFPGGTPDTSTSQNPVITYDTAGTYSVILTAWNGCDSATKLFTNYISINAAPVKPVFPKDTSFCGNFSLTLNSGSTGFNYLWSNGDTAHYITVNALGQYWVSVSGSCDTVVSDTLTIVVDTNTVLTVIPQTVSICPGTDVTLKVSGGGSNFTWSPSASLSAASGDSVVASPTATTTYSVRGNDSIGCPGKDTTIVVTIIPSPNKPTITVSVTGDTLTSSAGSYNQWNFNGTAINDSTRNILIIKGHARGYYSVTVTNPANGCTTTSDSTTSINRLSLISNQLSIYPNPTTGDVFIKINSWASNVNEWSLQLTDVLGRILFTMPSLNYSNEIDLSGLPGSMYFITVTNNTARAVFPVVKQ